ncbi:MAG TPA: DUF5615 family PIN-like protein [Tepidisphaeraceae bacterium]|jgi:hypothetical protein|nr:DUF5615 family PIN-like protein [Tepidisphaeraceae bacterium]
MQPAFLADHNLDDPIVEGVLRAEPSVQFVRAREVGLSRAIDDVVLDYAAAHSLIVVTHDVNTMIGFAYDRAVSGRPLADLFIARRSRPVARIVDDLLLVWGPVKGKSGRDGSFTFPYDVAAGVF